MIIGIAQVPFQSLFEVVQRLGKIAPAFRRGQIIVDRAQRHNRDNHLKCLLRGRIIARTKPSQPQQETRFAVMNIAGRDFFQPVRRLLVFFAVIVQLPKLIGGVRESGVQASGLGEVFFF